MFREVVVDEGWSNILSVDRPDSGPTYIHFAPFVAGRPNNRASRHLRLKNRRHGLRMARETRAAPTELRRVHGRQHHRRDMYVAPIVNELRTDGVGESHDGV